jgi:hypothetical protein
MILNLFKQFIISLLQVVIDLLQVYIAKKSC